VVKIGDKARASKSLHKGVRHKSCCGWTWNVASTTNHTNSDSTDLQHQQQRYPRPDDGDRRSNRTARSPRQFLEAQAAGEGNGGRLDSHPEIDGSSIFLVAAAGGCMMADGDMRRVQQTIDTRENGTWSGSCGWETRGRTDIFIALVVLQLNNTRAWSYPQKTWTLLYPIPSSLLRRGRRRRRSWRSKRRHGLSPRKPKSTLSGHGFQTTRGRLGALKVRNYR